MRPTPKFILRGADKELARKILQLLGMVIIDTRFTYQTALFGFPKEC
jgi:hypothetical protein